MDATGKPDPQTLYVELLMKALSFEMWDEGPRPVAEITSRKPRHLLLKALDALARPLGGLVAMRPAVTQQMRSEGMFWPSQAHTMIGRLRLESLREAVEAVLHEAIPGDFIETGVWRGGSCIFMRGLLEAHGDPARRVFVADSFAGLPPPDPERYPADSRDKLYRFKELAIPQTQVAENFRRYGLLDDRVIFVEGFFEHTLHKLGDERFSIIRLDGDMYSSTMQALEALYPKLSPGGFCIIDDYALPSCRKAVEAYRAEHGIVDPITQIDWCGVYWRKGQAAG